MKNQEIAVAIEHIAQTGEVLERLLGMPQHQIDRVLELLSDPTAVAALEKLLRTVKGLQDGRHGFRSNFTKTSIKTRSPRSNRATFGDEASLAESLDEFFSDKSQFPNVAAVQGFVKKRFNIKLREMNKEGRARYIKRLSKSLLENPEQMAAAQEALDELESHQKDRAYQQLYSFIRGRLS